MSKDCSAYRSVSYIHVRDGKAHSDGEGEVGEVELIRSLLAWKGKPSGRFFGSIVQVSVVKCIKSSLKPEVPRAALLQGYLRGLWHS
jgi:hypothetical protein